jgi:hypothetical protein
MLEGAFSPDLTLGTAAIVLAPDEAFSIGARAAVDAARARDALHAAGIRAVSEHFARLLALPVVRAWRGARLWRAAQRGESPDPRERGGEPRSREPPKDEQLHDRDAATPEPGHRHECCSSPGGPRAIPLGSRGSTSPVHRPAYARRTGGALCGAATVARLATGSETVSTWFSGLEPACEAVVIAITAASCGLFDALSSRVRGVQHLRHTPPCDRPFSPRSRLPLAYLSPTSRLPHKGAGFAFFATVVAGGYSPSGPHQSSGGGSTSSSGCSTSIHIRSLRSHAVSSCSSCSCSWCWRLGGPDKAAFTATVTTPRTIPVAIAFPIPLATAAHPLAVKSSVRQTIPRTSARIMVSGRSEQSTCPRCGGRGAHSPGMALQTRVRTSSRSGELSCALALRCGA